jgi:type I restriction enzyme S subunit
VSVREGELTTELGGFRAYPRYRDSGVEWLEQIPAHWEVGPLKFAVQMNRDVLPEDMDPEFTFRYVDIGSVDTEGNITGTEELRFASAPSRARRLVRPGDTILSTVRTYLRAIALIPQMDEPVVVSTGFAVLRPVPRWSSRFLSYAVRAEYLVSGVVANSEGVGYPAITPSKLDRLRIIVPPLPEQKTIAAFLDRETAKIDELVAKKERLIELLQEKRAAMITQAVTKGLDPNVPMKDSGIEWLGKIPARWEVKKVKRLSLVRRGASPRPIDDPIYFDEEGEYAWVRIADVTASERYLESTTQRLSALGKSKSVALEPGELFVSIAATVGKPVITKIKCCIHDGFVYFVGLRENREYLYYLFSCGEPYKGLGKLGTQLNLNTDTIGDIHLPRPSGAEQQAIVQFLDRETAKIDALVARVRDAIDRLKEFRSALISAAVTGKIDVRDAA